MVERVRNKLLENYSKIIYETAVEYILAQFFKDTIFLKNQIIQISGKGILNNTISCALMEKLDIVGIDNHHIEKINMREQSIQAVDIIPISTFITNFAYGRYVANFGIEEGYVFDKPMLDFQIKANNIPTAINEEQLISFGWITKPEIKMLKKNAYRVNDFLSGYFAGIGLRLVQVRLKFGRIFNGDEFVIMLAGEISPETCVLQDLETNEKFDIYSLNQDCGDTVKNALSIYNEIARRLER